MVGAETFTDIKARLEAFLAATDQLDLPLSGEVEKARDQAERLLEKLDASVRVAVAGARGTGKSGLVNLLTGMDVLSSGPDAYLLPPVILRHSPRERTFAGWWDRPEREFDGLDLSAALAESPDVISFGVDCEALQNLWLIDVSGIDRRTRGKEARFALSRLADVLLWCSNATEAAPDQEHELWQLLPPQLRRHSVLVLTHADQVDDRQAKVLQETLDKQRLRQFRSAVPIAVPAAWSALLMDGEEAESLWADSGGADLVRAVMGAVETFRADQLERVRRTIERVIRPVEEGLAASATVPRTPLPQDSRAGGVADSAVDGAAGRPVVVADEAPAPARLAETWGQRMEDLLDGIASGDIAGNAELIEVARGTVNGFLDVLVEPGALPPGADWVVSEFEKADDLLTLMQFESADNIAADAARVLVQLSDILSWGADGDAAV